MNHRFMNFLIGALLFLFLIFAPDTLPAGEYIYYSKGNRDPFIPLIASEGRVSLGLEVVETIDDVRFEGVIFDPLGESMAVLNGEVVKEGDKAYNIEVVKIYENAISIKIYDKTHTISLIKEGGEAVER